MCYHATYLHNGACIKTCPAGTQSKGKGNFRRRCEAIAASVDETAATAAADAICTGKTLDGGGVSCKCGDDCHTCGFFADAGKPGACEVCKNGMYLLDGVCVGEEACGLSGGMPAGKGLFGRRCDPLETDCVGKARKGIGSTQVSCSCGKGCHTCKHAAEPGACLLCKHGLYQFDGECVSADACEAADGMLMGKGQFGRRCEPAAGCRRKKNNCQHCSADGTTCEMCFNAKYLLFGECVASCPPGTKAKGKGNFNRRCE